MDPSGRDAKRRRGQFYTTRADHILAGIDAPPPGRLVEPFAGRGDLLRWLERREGAVEAYDIEPKHPSVVRRDTLRDPPDYRDAWVVTNPPYLARNKSSAKDVYDRYGTNDLYKCFLTNLVDQSCAGGILILPSGFFLSHREIDARCRHRLLSAYRLTRVRYFEEPAFEDTATTVVAFSFVRSDRPMTEQRVEWEMVPSGARRTFLVSERHRWVVGGEILLLPPAETIRRAVVGAPLRPGEQQTHMTLHSIDSGRPSGRIALSYRPGFVYPAKETTRTYATLRVSGRTLSDAAQRRICDRFNAWIEAKREATWSLFLPQFRESREYARKRIPFELAYRIVLHLIESDEREAEHEAEDHQPARAPPDAERDPERDQRDAE